LHLTIACDLSTDIYARHGGSVFDANRSRCGPQPAAAALANNYDEGTAIVLVRRVFPDDLGHKGYEGQRAGFAQSSTNWR
jgi:hypothetical protein